jgi:hypothetical protein
MHLNPRLPWFVAMTALFLAAAGCGSPSENKPDSSAGPDTSPVDARVAAPDAAAASDVVVTGDTATADAAAADAAFANDAAVDSVAVGLDGSAQGFDGGKPGWDALADAGSQADGPADAGGSQADGPADSADAGFVPGPATAAVVNGGTAGEFSLSDGTWKVFYFDAVAGQVYAVSGLSGIVHGYVSTSSSVSPSNYQFVTNADGNLSFAAPAAQRYYIAVAVSGGWVSGSFQVADGGTLIGLGSTPLALTAPDGDNTYFFRFPVATGHGYTFIATGPSQPSVEIAVSPRAERSSNGQLSYSIWGVGGSLPFTGYDIPAAAVATSYSGFCFFYINVTAAMTVTVTIAESL